MTDLAMAEGWMMKRWLIGAIVIAFAVTSSADQSSPASSTYRVAQMSDLTAKTHDEIARVRFFDKFVGGQRLRPGSRQTVLSGLPPPPVPPPASPDQLPLVREEYYRSNLRTRTCQADAIVIARADRTRAVFLNASETSLFTDFDVSITRWVKPLTGADSLLVSQVGGEVVVGNLPIASEYYGVIRITPPKTYGPSRSHTMAGRRRTCGRDL